MIFMVHTKDSPYVGIDPFKQMNYLEEVEAVSGHEACKKVRKENPTKVFLDWWKKK